MGKAKKARKNNKAKKKGISNPVEAKPVVSKNKITISTRVKNILAQPLNSVLLKFTALMGIFYLTWATQFFQESFVKYVALAYAKSVGLFLQMVKVPVLIMGDAIGDMNFAVSIKNGCDGIEAMAILLFAILVYPTSWNNRIKGFLIGAACLILLNFIRIISLYFIGTHVPSLFEVMHVSVWQAIFILVPLLIIFQWVNWIKMHSLKV